jgi:hypothetical protein
VVGAQEFQQQGRTPTPVTGGDGAGFYPARFVGGRFLARRDVFAAQVPRGTGVWGWTEFQQRQIHQAGWHVGWCIPAAVIEHVGDWHFKHPKAIRNDKYVKYFKATGRIR